MSAIVDRAKAEMDAVGIVGGDQEALVASLEAFFSRFDSGGSVWAMAPVLHRLIARKPLSSLTGSDDEWREVGRWDGHPVLQNVRCTSVFKQMRNGVIEAYDIHVKGRPTITFPYTAPTEVRAPEATVAGVPL